MRHKEITGLQSLHIGPFASLILRGLKQAKLDDNQLEFSVGQTSILSHDVLVQYRIAEIGEGSAPFIALLFNIDFNILRQLQSRIAHLSLPDQPNLTLDRMQQNAGLHSALERLLALDVEPLEYKILASSALEEVHYRLLQSQNAGMLRLLLQRDS